MNTCIHIVSVSHFKKNTSISFKEYSSDNNAKSTWLKAISQKDFYPNDETNFSKAYSKHFKELIYICCFEDQDVVGNINYLYILIIFWNAYISSYVFEKLYIDNIPYY